MRAALPLLVATALATSCKIPDRDLAATVVIPGRGTLPTFRVECRNDTSETVELLVPVNSLRLDGTVVTQKAVGSWLGGPPQMAPRSTRTELVAVAPPDSGGSDLGIPIFHVPLSRGQHTVAFRCGNHWSEDVVFYWEPR